MVGALDRVDRVDLHEAQPLDQCLQVSGLSRGIAEAMLMQKKPPGVGIGQSGAEGFFGCHSDNLGPADGRVQALDE